ncbi:MFS transporter [Paenibacillus harenae]|uniref:MFS transporter n=1 Tax=Paenibacillus harenae TaxID=306543 RepID=UPI0027926CB9|nr:MFS transporter [Paenibacillus harenae]MDQ0061389.1 MFS family permease [Paenibacillus harenae]
MKKTESSLDGNTSGKVSWGLLFVLCGAIFLEGIDVSMINVALPSIRTELGMSTSALSWVVSAYVLGYGGFMLLGGRAADLLGRRRMFLAWLGIFLVFSGIGGFATEGWMLIVARFVTGVAAAFMTPAGLSIITTSFPEGPKRNKALLVYAGTAAAGFSLGLVVGGLLTVVDWRWVFYAPVILALIILLAAIRLIPRSESPERSPHGFDFGGAITITAAMLFLVSTAVNAPEVEWGWTVGTFIAGLAFLAAFLVIERRSASPLMRLGILRSGALVRANLGAVLLAGSFFGFQFVVVLYLQELRGWSALETGLALLAVGVDAILAPTVTPRLVSRFGNARVILAGLSLAAVSYALFLPVRLDWSYAAMFPTMILTGIAFALTYGPLTIAATDGIAEGEQGLAGGLLSTSIQFGAALGLSVVTAVSIIAAGADGSPRATLEGFRTALWVPVAAAVLGAAITAIGLRKRIVVQRNN